ncbi:MAG: type II secretion system F family protein [Patescibacteria group bacterium]|nr:type II secretion system F family protein [Patescibacteria group bacterium]
MKFNFKAFDREGNFKEGVVEGNDINAAYQYLSDQNLTPTKVSPVNAFRIPILDRITIKDVAFFTRQLSYLVKARVPLDESLRALYQSSKKNSLKSVFFDLYSNLQAGMSLSQSFSKFPKIFSIFYIRIVEIGEVSGNLDETLAYLAEYLENQNRFMEKFLQASYYPIFVFCIFIGTMLTLSIEVIPQITKIFVEAKVQVPLITRIFNDIAIFIIHDWLYIIIFLGFAIYYGVNYFKTTEGKLFLFVTLDHTPVFGSIIKEIYLSRFLESLSFLVRGGVTVPETFDTIGRSMDNPIYEKALNVVADETRKGKRIYESLVLFPDLFPAIVIQTIQTGEKTGQLVEGIDRINLYFKDDIENKTASLGELIQPFMILILAGGLAFLELSLMIPLLKLTSAVQSL